MIKFWFFLLALLLNLSSTRAQLTGFWFTNPHARRVTIPFENHNNLVVIQVKVNHYPLRFILDSGVANTILLDKLLMPALGLKAERVVNVAGAGSDLLVNAMVTQPLSLELEGIQGMGQSLLVLEDDFLKVGSFFGLEVHGLIGFDLFSRFVVIIDYQNNTVCFQEPSTFRPGSRLSAIPFQLEQSKPFVRSHIVFEDGKRKELRMLLDLGASHSCMLEMAESDSSRIPRQRLDGMVGRGLGGEIPGVMGRVPQLSLGPFLFRNPIISFTSDYSRFFEGLQPRDGILGSEIFSRFRVIFDYSRQILYLKKNHRFDEPFEYNMSGLELMSMEENPGAFRIYAVRKDSPAEQAGIRAGDIINRVNGVYSGRFSLAELSAFLRSREGRKVKLGINRSGAELRVSFRLRRLI